MWASSALMRWSPEINWIAICLVFTVNEILGAAAKERSAESPSSTEDSKSSKGLCTRLDISFHLDTFIRGHTIHLCLALCLGFIFDSSLHFSNFNISINLLFPLSSTSSLGPAKVADWGAAEIWQGVQGKGSVSFPWSVKWENLWPIKRGLTWDITDVRGLHQNITWLWPLTCFKWH